MKSPSPYPRAILFGVLALVTLMIIGVMWAVIEMVALHPGRQQWEYVDSLTVFYAASAIPVIILYAWAAARRVTADKAIVTGLIVGALCLIVEWGTQIASTGALPSPLLLTGGMGLSKLISGLLGGWLGRQRPAR
ncbi:MAG: hypothetical protein DI623_06890 [Sphingomonas sanxanigenens]|uniref:Uncharacterized protein n=1 Tax=Sphingomonas sanxanigenens TaxID=397260 RepID=A0A2W5ADP6_9SPHN|nr:MAG: hypothetical protein DI623_06890 [Sphingomonas sanxanigenens]